MGSSKPFMERNKAAVLYTLGGLILLAVILGLALGLGLPKLSSGSTPSPVPCVMATAIMTNTTSGINGFITFQTTASGGVNVTVKLTGVTTNTGFQNGLHVHANLVTSTTENLCVAAVSGFVLCVVAEIVEGYLALLLCSDNIFFFTLLNDPLSPPPFFF